MFNEVGQSVFRNHFIARASINNKAAMGNHSGDPVMYKSQAVVKGVEKKFHIYFSQDANVP
jgi:hypothetical protein